MFRQVLRVVAVMLVLLGVAGLAQAGGPPPPPAPEINPGSMISAMAVLAGGVLLLADRLRRSRSSK